MDLKGETTKSVIQHLLIELVCEHDLSVAEAIAHITTAVVTTAKEIYPDNFAEDK